VQWSPPAFAQTKAAVKPTTTARWHVHPVNSAAGSWRCRAGGVGRGAENARHRLAARPSKAKSTIMTSEQFREPLADHREGQFEGQNGAGATVRRPAPVHAAGCRHAGADHRCRGAGAQPSCARFATPTGTGTGAASTAGVDAIPGMNCGMRSTATWTCTMSARASSDRFDPRSSRAPGHMPA
jgi:hypothetical protein